MLAVAGCGDSSAPDNRPDRVPFSGIATLKGAKLQDAYITFHPTSDPGYGASGKADSSGNFVMGTFSSNDGVVPGKYKVSVTKSPTDSGEAIVSDEDPEYDGAPTEEESSDDGGVPANFQDPATSGVTVEVTEAVEDYKLEFK